MEARNGNFGLFLVQAEILGVEWNAVATMILLFEANAKMTTSSVENMAPVLIMMMGPPLLLFGRNRRDSAIIVV